MAWRRHACAAWLVLLSAAGCGGGRILTGPRPDAGAEVPRSIPDGAAMQDTEPICGQTASTCYPAPDRVIPGATDCALRMYAKPRDNCFCYCATDEIGCGAHGRCLRRGESPPECECESSLFTGPYCDVCAYGRSGPDCTEGCSTGTIPTEQGCQTPCQIQGITCSGYAYCSGAVDPSCVCLDGHAGPDCSQCAPGFRGEWSITFDSGAILTCTPFCEPCAPSRRCGEKLRPPACVCRSAYLDDGGNCVWKGTDLALPSSTEDCGAWRFFVEDPSGQDSPDHPPDPSKVSVGVVGGRLVFHVEGCYAAAAGTMLDVPASDTMPDAALRITFSGDVGEYVLVYLGGSLDAKPGDDGWRVIGLLTPTASGDQAFEICIPAALGGEHTGLLLWAQGRDSPCDANRMDFTISELSLIASTYCPSP